MTLPLAPKQNKKGSRYRRLMEIRSRNSFRKKGLDSKSEVLGTDLKRYTYKDWIILL